MVRIEIILNNSYFNLGDVHFYNDDLDTWNSDIYPIPRFLSETGIQSMPSIQTWQQITYFSEDFYFNSTLLQNRQHHPDGQKKLM
jgi:beta-mannosidase